MEYGLKPEVIHRIQGVFAKYPEIESAILYGSRAKGDYRPGSDIDLTFKGKNINSSLLAKVSNDLDDLLTPYKFDLSSFSHIKNEELLDHISRVGVEFYKAPQIV
jgi:predicted nucleotidyltransferase